MQVAVIGTGNIGGTLARKWAAAGHEVRLGVRDPQATKVQDLLKQLGPKASAGSLEQAIHGADAILFAMPGAAMAEAIDGLGGEMAGKIVLDATNNIGGGALNSMQVFSAKAPDAHVFRAFNTLGWENFDMPTLGGQQIDLFYCGPSGEAQKTAEQLISDVGLRPVYVGGPEQAGVVDGVASLWFALVFGQKHPRRLAFKVLSD